jgi:hypothetical protein
MLSTVEKHTKSTSSLCIMQRTSNDRVKIKSKKTEIIRINDNKAKNKPLTLFKETIREKHP